MNTQEATTPTQPDLKRLRKRIKDRERRFKAATPAGKRVMIAKDVLEQLDTRWLKARRNSWLISESNLLTDHYITEHTKNTDLQEEILKLPSCTACAVGAMFACAVRRADDLTLEDMRYKSPDGSYVSPYADFGWDGLVRYLSRWFSYGQLKMIEHAFERGSGGSGLSDEEFSDPDFMINHNASVVFGSKFVNDTERMVAIMQNIIKHKGEFRPDQP